MERINAVRYSHLGLKCIRGLLNRFELSNKDGTYQQCLVHKPMSMTLGALRARCCNQRISEIMLQILAIRMLFALDFLHTEAKVIHGGIYLIDVILGQSDH